MTEKINEWYWFNLEIQKTPINKVVKIGFFRRETTHQTAPYGDEDTTAKD
jgi:hypothetical protein